jgi:hypothetical protein
MASTFIKYQINFFNLYFQMYILHKNDNNTSYQTKEVQKIKCIDVGMGSVTTLTLGS